ncbi:MAG: zinc-finger domain-containing protein [Candidatus Zeuxoniibacter abyssi]|nr:MAG: zinc-finger domain-containing protein [Candidatus Persebacteraceae bacterium AB1(2)]
MVNLGKLKAIAVPPSALPWSCPPPNKAKWNSHPRVFINLTAKQPEQQCPYCSARYVLQPPDTKDGGG